MNLVRSEIGYLHIVVECWPLISDELITTQQLGTTNLRMLNCLPKLELQLILVRSSRDTSTGRNALPMDGKANIPGHFVDFDLLRGRRRRACSGTKSDS